MPITLDVYSDYLLFDNTEPVDVTLRSIDEEVRIENALRRQLSRREQDLYGALLTNQSVIWEIPVEQLGPFDVQEGDFISELENDSTTVWTVVSAQHATLKTRWRCVCNKQR